jgi:hypothetical protein
MFLSLSRYEWGNPNNLSIYEPMLDYSPYDRIRPQAYPNMLITAGLTDSRVKYYEPTKYVAKLRSLKTNERPVDCPPHSTLSNGVTQTSTLLQVDPHGHFGASGAEHDYQDAQWIAFVLDSFNQTL